MNIKLYAIGTLKDKNQIAAIKEYEKRLSRYCKFEMVVVKNMDQLMKKINSKTYVIKISPEGKLFSSEDLADKINQLGVSGTSDLSFVYLEDIEVKEHLAISKMDMSLGMAMTILTEQIYRGYRIIHNQAYHK